jgi:inward rectifier potassium channel
MAAPVRPREDESSDLGLGSRVAQQSRVRFLNRDGTFNAARLGLSFGEFQNRYHLLLTISWTKFVTFLVLCYFLANTLFAFLYVLCGPGALHGATGVTLSERFTEAFFFSVQTLATIGYGVMSPSGLAANILVTVEALTGLLGFALATGILFARFSRPGAKIIFSRNAIIAPYRGITAFEFRIANSRSSELIDVQATVVLSRTEFQDGISTRRFHPLSLERSGVMFFPLHWVVVHPIDRTSPLFGVTKEAFEASDPEFLVLLTGVDETFSQTVHTRSSYKHHEIIWGATFSDMFIEVGGSNMGIDLRRIHDTETSPLSPA